MKKILLIEDEAQHADLVTLRLERKGYKVVRAGTAAEGIAAAAKEQADLILTDLLLPDMAPEALLTALAKASRKGTPVIGLTALDEFEIERRGLDRSLDGLVRKPYENSELMTAIENALRAGTRGGGAKGG